jgi:mannosyl-3-phosphoglycerate phosphatase
LTIGLGDSLNDYALLESVDVPVLVKKENGSYQEGILDKLKVLKAPEKGPGGWNQAVLDLIGKYDSEEAN